MEKLANALAARFVSPTRSARLTVVLGRWLGLSFTLCFLTGLFSHGLQEDGGAPASNRRAYRTMDMPSHTHRMNGLWWLWN